MILGEGRDKFAIFLPPKCGGTFLWHRLCESGPCRRPNNGRPTRFQVHEKVLEGRKLYSVLRNPWDWYVSFWAYNSVNRSSSRWFYAVADYAKSDQMLDMLPVLVMLPDDLKLPKGVFALDHEEMDTLDALEICRTHNIGLATQRQIVMVQRSIDDPYDSFPDDVFFIRHGKLTHEIQEILNEQGIDLRIDTTPVNKSRRPRNLNSLFDSAELYLDDLNNQIAWRDRILVRAAHQAYLDYAGPPDGFLPFRVQQAMGRRDPKNLEASSILR